MNKHCLVIIDPQYDFINNNGQYAGRHDGMTQIMKAKHNIETLLNHLDHRSVLIIFSNYQPNQFAADLSIAIPGTIGNTIEIDKANRFTRIAKTTHSAFSSEDFIHYLKKNSISTLVLCGFLAEYCINATAIDGINRGYNITILEDCIGTGDDVQERQSAMLKDLQGKSAIVQASSEYLSLK